MWFQTYVESNKGINKQNRDRLIDREQGDSSGGGVGGWRIEKKRKRTHGQG